MKSSTYTRSGSRGAEFGRNAADVDDARGALRTGMRSFDEEGLERTDNKEWGDRVEREDISPVLCCLGFEKI